MVEAESLQRARLEVFDEDVGTFDQGVEYAPALGLFEVEREAFLVAIDAEEVGALARHERRSPGAGVVASLRDVQS